jgi:flotillin
LGFWKQITELVQLLTVAGMMKTVPLNDLFNMAGLNLPTYLKAMTNLKKLNQLLQNKINTPTEEQK